MQNLNNLTNFGPGYKLFQNNNFFVLVAQGFFFGPSMKGMEGATAYGTEENRIYNKSSLINWTTIY